MERTKRKFELALNAVSIWYGQEDLNKTMKKGRATVVLEANKTPDCHHLLLATSELEPSARYSVKQMRVRSCPFHVLQYS